MLMKKRPTILFVVRSLGIGGAQKMAIEIANSVVKRSFKAVVLNFAIKDDEELLREISADIPVHKSKHFAKLSRGKFLPSLISSIYATYETARIIRRENVDIVYTRHGLAKLPASIASLILGMQNKTVLVAASNFKHQIELRKSSYLSKRLIFVARKLAYKVAGTIVANSKGLAQETREYFAIKRKVLTITNGIDPKIIRDKAKEKADHPYLSGDVPVIVSVGRLAKQKDFLTLIKSIAIVNIKTPVRLLIIGGGKLKHTLKEYAKGLGWAESVSLIGSMPNPYPFMKAADLYVCSSLYEGFSNSLLEAMALSLPIVSTNHDFGANEMIEDGKSGILVPIADPEAMAKAIFRILKDGELRKRLSQNARARAQDFTLQKTASAYEKLFREVAMI